MILLDSHIIIWLMISPERLSGRAHDAILQARTAGKKLAYSPVSLYEVAYAARRNRLHVETTIQEFMASIQARLELVPLTAAIAVCAAQIPAGSG